MPFIGFRVREHAQLCNGIDFSVIRAVLSAWNVKHAIGTKRCLSRLPCILCHTPHDMCRASESSSSTRSISSPRQFSSHSICATYGIRGGPPREVSPTPLFKAFIRPSWIEDVQRSRRRDEITRAAPSVNFIDANRLNRRIRLVMVGDPPAKKRRKAKPTSQRTQKARRVAPSEYLIAALQALGYHHALPPQSPHKKNLSYISPLPPHNVTRQQEKRVFKVGYHGPLSGAEGVRPTLPGILAQYLLYVYPILQLIQRANMAKKRRHDAPLFAVFEDKNLAYLRSRGFDVQDVMAWAWILTAEDADLASFRLLIASKQPSRDVAGVAPLPTFVVLFLLRRERISARALKTILTYVWYRLEGVPIRSSLATLLATSTEAVGPEPWSGGEHTAQPGLMAPAIGETSLITMIVRLIRHARRVCPQALLRISELVTSHLGRSSGVGPEDLLPETTSRLARVYNRILSLLSEPSSVNPYIAMSYHQRAQFKLIRRMAEYNPPLPVSREGYRGVIRVQLAHGKTATETLWASRKATSWPPWKRERLGIDAETDCGDGGTRATEAISRMQEAGYSSRDPEKLARIYAGWDTDDSPTIQTRHILSRARTNHEVERDEQYPRDEGPEHNENGNCNEHRGNFLWAARVRATRTVQEAWACFLSLEDADLRPTPEVYHAMFEKLVYHRLGRHRRKAKHITGGQDMLSDEIEPDNMSPGDGREVSHVPVAPHEAVYVRSDPPGVVDLFEQMVRDGLRPSTSCLTFLVKYAETMESAVKFLATNSSISIGSLSAMFLDLSFLSDRETAAQHLRAIPEKVFSAFIQVLCRTAIPTTHNPTFKHSVSTQIVLDRAIAASARPRVLDPQFDRLRHAFDLMALRKPTYRPAWNALLRGSSRGMLVSNSRTLSSGPEFRPKEVRAWDLIQNVVSQMRDLNVDIDEEAFHILCLGLEHAAFTSLEIISSKEDRAAKMGDLPKVEHSANKVLQDGANYIKSSFDALTGTSLVAISAERKLGEHVQQQTSGTGGLPALPLLPTLLSTPPPINLHALARVLGGLSDFRGLADLAAWMAKFASDIDVVAREKRRGRKKVRLTLTAVRVYLEHSWDVEEVYTGADGDLIDEVRGIVDSVDHWGGWPDDEEVEAYCLSSGAHFPRLVVTKEPL